METKKREPLFGDGLLPFGDKAEMVKAYEAARAKDAEEIAKWKGIVKGVHGALNDIGTVPVPAMDADLYDAVMAIRAKDAELIQRLVNGLEHAQKLRNKRLRSIDRDLEYAAAAGFKPSED